MYVMNGDFGMFCKHDEPKGGVDSLGMSEKNEWMMNKLIVGTGFCDNYEEMEGVRDEIRDEIRDEALYYIVGTRKQEK